MIMNINIIEQYIINMNIIDQVEGVDGFVIAYLVLRGGLIRLAVVARRVTRDRFVRRFSEMHRAGSRGAAHLLRSAPRCAEIHQDAPRCAEIYLDSPRMLTARAEHSTSTPRGTNFLLNLGTSLRLCVRVLLYLLHKCHRL